MLGKQQYISSSAGKAELIRKLKVGKVSEAIHNHGGMHTNGEVLPTVRASISD